MFTLSGAINVLLFLIIRPRLLLFPGPRKVAELEERPRIFAFEGSRNHEASGVGPTQRFDDI